MALLMGHKEVIVLGQRHACKEVDQRLTPTKMKFNIALVGHFVLLV